MVIGSGLMKYEIKGKLIIDVPQSTWVAEFCEWLISRGEKFYGTVLHTDEKEPFEDERK